jgi:hypothetical protein
MTSTRLRGPINQEASQLVMLATRAPNSADQKLAMLTLSSNQTMSPSIPELMPQRKPVRSQARD